MNHFPEFAAVLPPVNREARRCPVPPEEASHRILIQRHGGHGDILMASPLLTALRDAYPEAHLTWAAERTEREAVEANPCVDRVLLWDSFYWFRLRREDPAAYAESAGALRSLLRGLNLDVFITFQPEEWTHLVTRQSGAPVRIGVFDGFRRYFGPVGASPLEAFYSHPFSSEGQPLHRTDQNLLPLQALGLPPATDKRLLMGYTAEDAATVAGALGALGLRGARFAVLAPRAKWPSRCWPEERFAALGDRLARRGFPVVLSGSAADAPVIQRIAARMTHEPYLCAGALSFRELAVLLDRAALVVSGDTGPMHLAAAVDTPYVALFGPTPVDALKPLAARGVALSAPLPCAPCYQKRCPLDGDDHMRCLRLLSVDEAEAAALELLGPFPVSSE